MPKLGDNLHIFLICFQGSILVYKYFIINTDFPCFLLGKYIFLYHLNNQVLEELRSRQVLPGDFCVLNHASYSFFLFLFSWGYSRTKAVQRSLYFSLISRITI